MAVIFGSFSASSSGMTASQARLDVAAHNVANLSTEGFKRQQVSAAEVSPTGGVVVSLSQSAATGARMEDDVVGAMQAKNDFQANAMALRISNSAVVRLLDATA